MPEEFVESLKEQPSHYLIYGSGGTRKSTLVATFPKPMIVHHTDPFSKDNPYLRKGRVTDFKKTPDGILYREVYSNKNPDKLLIRIEYFHDTDPDCPTGFEMWEHQIATTDFSQYKTWAIDSYTSLEALARLKANSLPHKNEDGWFVPNEARKMLERYMRHVFFGVYINLVLIAHVTRERVQSDTNESMISNVYAPAAIGQFKEDLTRIFPETYVTRVVKKDGEHKIILQTEISSKYSACTQIPAPNNVELTADFGYKDLWKNFKG